MSTAKAERKRNETRPHRAESFASAARTAKPRHGLARARPDLPALRALHSSPAIRRNNIGSLPGLCSFVPTATNSRDRREKACAIPILFHGRGWLPPHGHAALMFELDRNRNWRTLG
jgi:hypothetical protein